MHKTLTPNAGPSAVSVLAASYIAGIFEDFLARDEIQYLPAIFTFYALAAAVSLLSFHRYPHLRKTAELDLAVLVAAETELGKRWPTALGMRNALETMIESIPREEENGGLRLEVPRMEIEAYFDGFGASLCRIRDALSNPTSSAGVNCGNVVGNSADTLRCDYPTTGTSIGENPMSGESLPLEKSMAEPGFEGGWNESMFDLQHDDVGFWLFDNRGADFPFQ